MLGKGQIVIEFMFYFISQRHVLTGILTRRPGVASGNWDARVSIYYKELIEWCQNSKYHLKRFKATQKQVERFNDGA